MSLELIARDLMSLVKGSWFGVSGPIATFSLSLS